MQDVLFVCLMGIGTVFAGLVGIILLCIPLRLLGSGSSRRQPAPTVSASDTAVTQELIAAISAAIAEDIGEDISAFRITSIRKI